jgi:hypothetical protein
VVAAGRRGVLAVVAVVPEAEHLALYGRRWVLGGLRLDRLIRDRRMDDGLGRGEEKLCSLGVPFIGGNGHLVQIFFTADGEKNPR